jgi:hypothetical protein
VPCAPIVMHGEKDSVNGIALARARETNGASKGDQQASFELTRSEIESLKRGKQRIAEYALKEFQGWKDSSHDRPAGK